jgi:hypothetical protein
MSHFVTGTSPQRVMRNAWRYEVGILESVLRRRDPGPKYRTVDGGHPAPYPDMTDEQLYNYEVAFKVPKRTFDKPPPAARTTGDDQPTVTRQRTRSTNGPATATNPRVEPVYNKPAYNDPVHKEGQTPGPARPLDFSKPVRTITTKQPVEIITTRARHPVYKVHGYIGDSDIVTVFTLDGRISENGPVFLENIPQQQQLYLNIYLNPNPLNGERFILTQHESRAAADAAARNGRVACEPLQFDLE